MNKILLTVLVTATLAACGTPYVADNTPPLQSKLKVGDAIQLKRELTFLPTERKIGFQFSEVIGSGAMQLSLRKYHADCALKLDHVYYKRVVVKPQEFSITRIEPYNEPALLDMIYSGVRIHLKSAGQPEVAMLDCRNPTEVYPEMMFTTGLFDRTVGEIMAIKRAP